MVDVVLRLWRVSQKLFDETNLRVSVSQKLAARCLSRRCEYFGGDVIRAESRVFAPDPCSTPSSQGAQHASSQRDTSI